MPSTTVCNEFWTATSGDLAQRRQRICTPEHVSFKRPATKVIIDPSRPAQPWIGAGAAITDAAASLIWGSMDSKQRRALLTELFDPSQGGFSCVRVPLGSCEPASQPYYTYDDLPFGEHDATLSHFSIGEGMPGAPDATKDLKYIVPVLQEILEINPAVKVLASPWSAPAWMKNTGSLTHGGHLRFGEWTGNGFDPMKDSFEGAYARYFVKYIEAYERYGIPIYGVTIQNEPGNAAPWPAMIWTDKQMADFAYRFLRPAFNDSYPDTKIFLHDDNVPSITRPLSQDVTAEEASAIDGLAVHTYDGPFDRLYNASRVFPQWQLWMTERRCMMAQTPEDAAHIAFGICCNWLIHNGMNAITMWNLALDERGLPNMIGATGRRGVVTIQHETGEVRRNLEYFMLRNLGQDVPAGSHVIASSNYTKDGYSGGLGSVAFRSGEGDTTAILYNPTGSPITAALTVNGRGNDWQYVDVPAWGTVTMHTSQGLINDSVVPEDDDFQLNPSAPNLAGDLVPGQAR